MIPSFNTAGPCVPGKHYMLPPERRLGHVMQLVDEEKYFTLHAGWQMGKTTSARWLVEHYNAGTRHACVWIDIQNAGDRPDPAPAFRTLLNDMKTSIARDLPSLPQPDVETLLRDPDSAILDYLRELSAKSPRPLVVLFDEADGLVGPAMVSFLKQLRQGYIDRSRLPFPHSLALIGRRQVRDYVLTQNDRKAVSWLGTSSPFNINAEAPTLSVFSRAEVEELLQQHTLQTGQRFEPEAIDRIVYLSQGHPWLVNAMADQIVNRDVVDRSVAITTAHVEAAKETLILERRSHIDSLIARLREPRVRHILEPMLVGDRLSDSDALDDDLAYVLGLGLIAKREREYVIANPIYQEVVPRVLTHLQQMQINQPTGRYVKPNGGLDMNRLMAGWQEFWREDGHLAAAGFTWREAGPHLMLMAFLQAIINGGGRIDREYGLGRKALDLLISWRAERYAIEVKVRRERETVGRGLKQLAGYLDLANLDEGWLVVFDPRKNVSWKEKLKTRRKKVGRHEIWIVGC